MDCRHAPPSATTARTRWFCPTPNCSNGSRAGATRPRLECDGQPLQFHGQIAALTPHLENGDKELSFTHRFTLPGGENHSVADAKFFNRQPPLALVDGTFYLLRNAPPPPVLKYLAHKPSVPVRKLSHRLLLHLRKTQSNHGVDWEQLCVAHRPRRSLSLSCSTTRCGCGCWPKASATRASGFGTATNGSPNDRARSAGRQAGNSRRPAPRTRRSQWLRKLDWFTPEPGLWIGDANENFLGSLAGAWAGAPGRGGISRQPGVSPSVPARRASSSRGSSSRAAALTGWPSPPNGRPRDSNFPRRIWNGSPPPPAALSNCRTPAGWNWTPTAVQGAHEAMADMGVDGLIAVPQKVGMEHVAHLDEERVDAVRRFAGGEGVARARSEFKGVPSVELPEGLAGRAASVSKGRLRFSLPPHADQARRHSRRRHGPGQNAADARVAGVAQGAATKKIPSRRSSSVRRPCCTTGGARRSGSRRT